MDTIPAYSLLSRGTIYDFAHPATHGAVALANRKATKGHRHWMVWDRFDHRYAARANAANLERALREAHSLQGVRDNPAIWIFSPDGRSERYGRGGFEIILKNMRDGRWDG